jgi:hypothetical protein
MISEIMATGASQQQMETEVRICCVIQVKMWPLENRFPTCHTLIHINSYNYRVPLSTTSLIELIKMTRSWRKRAPDRPDTKPTIGLFLLNLSIERHKFNIEKTSRNYLLTN